MQQCPCSLPLPGCCWCLHCAPLLAVLAATCRYVDPWPGVGWVCAMSLPLSSPSSALCLSWGSPHLVQGCAGQGFGMTSIAWSGAEQSFNSNPPSGGHHGDRGETPRAGEGLQDMTQAVQVQYSCVLTPAWLLGLDLSQNCRAEEGVL